MQSRPLGSSGIEVSRIGLGTNYVGGYGLYAEIDEDEGVRLVHRAMDLGVTFLDTADIYGFGRSEELVGKAIADRRSDVVLATKGANAFENGERTGVNNEPAYLRAALEASLKRLGTDYVDLYYIHRFDDRTPPEESLGELIRMKEAGLIRAIGVSNFEPAQLHAALKGGPIDALQSQYNLFQRGVEAEVLTICQDNGISFIPWGPLAYGLLGGKYTRDYQLPENDWRHRTGLFGPDDYGPTLDKVDELKQVAEANDIRLPHLATQWLLEQPTVASVIAGAKTAVQVEDNAAADGFHLSQDALGRIGQICAAA